MKPSEFVERLAERVFRVERYEAVGRPPDESIEEAARRLFVALSTEEMRPVAHQMTLDLLHSIHPSLADVANLQRVMRFDYLTQLRLPGDSSVGDLFLLGPCVAYLDVSHGGLLQHATAVHLSVLYFGRRPDRLPGYVGKMTRALVGTGLLDEGVELKRVKPEGDDTAWMDGLPNMMPAPKLNGARLVGGLALTHAEARRELRQIKNRHVEPQSLGEFDRLQKGGLLTHLFARLCRDDKEGVVGSSHEDLLRPGLLCAVCQKDARDHPIHELVTPSELGRQLSDGSRWMAELSAFSLQVAGVPRSSIRVPDESRSPDPFDLAFVFDGNRYVCELKDRNVNAGDAGRFVGRAGGLPQHRALIITTESVEGEAVRVFNPGFGRVGLGGSSRHVTFIEGPDCVTDGLRWEIVFARLRDFAAGVRLPGPGSGLDVHQLLLAHFQKVWRDEGETAPDDSHPGDG